MTLSSSQELRTEGNKLLHDTMKQLVTISSGSILVLIALLEKLFRVPKWRPLIALAFLGFLISIIASLAMMRAISLNVGAGFTQDYQYLERPVRRSVYVAFVLAIGALVLFVIRNLNTIGQF